MDAARPTLLSAAKAFLRRSASKTVIAPLAAVTLAATAQAQVVLNVPTGSSYSGGSVSGGSFFAQQLAASNDITGVRYGITSITLSGDAGSGPPYQTFFLGNSPGWTGIIPAGTTIPISYSFTLGQSGALSITTWDLTFRFGPESAVTIGSGSGTGLFSGSTDYVVGGSPLDGSAEGRVYETVLTVNFSGGAGQYSLAMDSGTGGISVNASAIPEPQTYARWLGTAGLLLVLRRRVQRFQPA
jgi:hypothetical protein